MLIVIFFALEYGVNHRKLVIFLVFCFFFFDSLVSCLIHQCGIFLLFNVCRMAEALCAYIEKDRPFLGICLGLQLLFESSEENGPGQ